MEMGGPEVTEGLSPMTRSYWRMFTEPKLSELRCLRCLEPRWRDSCSVREVMMERIGCDSIDSEEARMRTVGAELFRYPEEEERERALFGLMLTV